MNLNTETGRLSARKPNLQNVPAMDKDTYGIRKAFVAEEGNKFIIADYGQLELRVLAHMTNCKGMIEAFALGGDFHSRTALGMYPEIQQKLDAGEILLEWDFSKGEPPVPLLKDVFGNERKKAKIMNFSIAYGKTVHGFMKDWNCSEEEARQTVDLWYNDRPEVKAW
jgi:DNA polymerase I